MTVKLNGKEIAAGTLLIPTGTKGTFEIDGLDFHVLKAGTGITRWEGTALHIGPEPTALKAVRGTRTLFVFVETLGAGKSALWSIRYTVY